MTPTWSWGRFWKWLTSRTDQKTGSNPKNSDNGTSRDKLGSKYLLTRWTVIAIFRITSGFLAISGSKTFPKASSWNSLTRYLTNFPTDGMVGPQKIGRHLESFEPQLCTKSAFLKNCLNNFYSKPFLQPETQTYWKFWGSVLISIHCGHVWHLNLNL